MRVADLKHIIEKLPDDMDVEIFNNSYEWYGLESIKQKAMKRLDDKLVLNFGGEWDDYEVNAYREERRKAKGAA
jgi:hypothetical protein